MWTWLASIISGPLIGGIIKAYQAKLAAGNTTDKIGADLAIRELEVQDREVQAQSAIKIAEVGHWYEPEKLMAYIAVSYFAKVVTWDNVLGDITHGSTPAIHGDVATWLGLVFAFYLGKRGIENVARIVGNRFGGK